jgi:predicted O-methyltransferase YrrM
VETETWTRFHNLLGVDGLGKRLDILRRQYLNHRFDRRSPLPPLPPPILDAIYDYEVCFPPRRFLMQPGTQTIDGTFFLVSLARALRARTVFEIGTYIGLTAWTLALNLPEAVVHSLDIPPDAAPEWALEQDDVHRGSEEHLVYRGRAEEQRIRQHWSDSATFDFGPYEDSIDLVYIDGAHSEPYVESDTDNALRVMAAGGAVVWDDYWRHSPGVAAVLHRRAKELDLRRVPGTRLVVHLSPGAAARLG